VDTQCESIYAVFRANSVGRSYWRWVGYCIAAQDTLGKLLIARKATKPLPSSRA